MQRHTTSHLENRIRGAFQWESGGWEAEARTPPGVLLIYLWELCLMSRLICMIFVVDLFIGLILKSVLWHVDQYLRGCGVGSLCGCGKPTAIVAAFPFCHEELFFTLT